jgi:DNA-binding transcriptional regulator YiaG
MIEPHTTARCRTEKPRRMKQTIQQLREDRGESRSDLAEALGVTVQAVTEWETGRTEPRMSQLQVLTEHFGVRDDQIELKPGRPPSIGDRLADLF